MQYYSLQAGAAQQDGLDEAQVTELDQGLTTIGRIIAEGPQNDTDSYKKKYLVKWRGVPYDECSWEKEEDLLKLAAPALERELLKLRARGPIVTNANLAKFRVISSFFPAEGYICQVIEPVAK